MSVRLSKIGNIAAPIPYTQSSSINFQNAPSAVILRDRRTWPFVSSNLLGQKFRAYRNAAIGDSGSVIGYSGQGVWTFRAGKGDYFLAGFELDQLFDSERDTPALVGIHSVIEVITSSSSKLPSIFPMIVWADRSTDALKNILGYNCLSPKLVARFTSGVSRSMLTTELTLELSPVCAGALCSVYFGWFVGRDVASHDTADYEIQDCNASVAASSLKGNRPVFDPVMV